MKTLVIHSDQHINSTVGLCKPLTELDDGGAYKASDFQRWTWKRWNETLETIDKMKRGELVTVFNGDIAEGDSHRRSNQIITRNRADIVRMASEILEPAVNASDTVYFIKGTAAHGGKSGELETLIADDFDNVVPDPDTGRSTWWHLPLKIEGVTFDIMHHPKGNGGGRPMNSQGVVDRMASDTVFQYANAGERPPNFVIRSHIHHWLDSNDAFITRAIVTPAWSLLTEFGHRIGLSHNADIGSVLFYIDGDQCEVHPIKYQTPKKKWQVVIR